MSLAADNAEGRLPPHVWDGVDDPQLPALKLVDASQRLPARGPRRLMSNSFAFGGNNVSLILGDTP
ncbi:3-oxoacyl-(acyl carrier protein) synthase I [compost metagenome]